MSKRMNRREALKVATAGVLSVALPGGDNPVSQTTEDDRGGIGFVSDTGERFLLAGDGWALALGMAERDGWRFEPWSLSAEHERQAASILAERTREVEIIKTLRDSGEEDFTDVDEEELDLDDFRDEVRHRFFSPAKAASLALILRKALNDPEFENQIDSTRAPGRHLIQQSIAASSGHTRSVQVALAESIECKDIRGRLEAFVAFCDKGGFRLDSD